jgi:hypothetical protein
VFGIDRYDARLADARLGRTRCSCCHYYFQSTGSGICDDCIEREPWVAQDNNPPNSDGFFKPREPIEIVVARRARATAEQQADEYRRAMLYLHQVVASIAGAADRPLRLFPRDQHKVAKHALETFAADYGHLLQMMDLLAPIKSETIEP